MTSRGRGRMGEMCGYIQRGAFTDLRPGRRRENKINFGMFEPMGRMCNEMEGTAGFVTCDRRVVIDRELTVQVRRKDGMDCAPMSMTHIPMMIRLGMHVEEWNYEHP